MQAIYTEDIKIEEFYADFQGKLQIKWLSDILSNMAGKHSVLGGISVKDLNEIGQTWMLLRLHVIINQFPDKGDIVKFNTWSAATERLFAVRDYQVLDSNGNEIAYGDSRWMIVDVERRRPVRLNEKVVEGTEATAQVVKHRDVPSILNEKSVPDNLSECKAFYATYSNIDFNGHVTQSSYVRWITDALSFDFLAKHVLKEIEVVYEHEVLPDTHVMSTFERLPERRSDGSFVILHKLVSEDDGRVHCTAKTIWKENE